MDVMRNSLIIILLVTALPLGAQRKVLNFNSNWQLAEGSMQQSMVTLPRAWNEKYAFRVPIENLPDDTVRYVKTFVAPKEWKDKKIFIEFSGFHNNFTNISEIPSFSKLIFFQQNFI